MRFVLSVLLVACAPTTTEEQAEDWEVGEDTGVSGEEQPEDDRRVDDHGLEGCLRIPPWLFRMMLTT